MSKACVRARRPPSRVARALRKQRLPEIWNNPDAFAYNRKFRVEDLKGSCAGCEFGDVCRGGCTWTSVAHSGHPHGFSHCYYKVAG